MSEVSFPVIIPVMDLSLSQPKEGVGWLEFLYITVVATSTFKKANSQFKKTVNPNQKKPYSSFLKLTKVTTDNNILLASCGALCADVFSYSYSVCKGASTSKRCASGKTILDLFT